MKILQFNDAAVNGDAVNQRAGDCVISLPRQGLNLKAQGREQSERTLGKSIHTIVLRQRRYINVSAHG